MPDVHAHQLVLLGYLDEGYGARPVRWCLDCGLVMEDFGEGRFAEMVPSWSREKLESSERRRELFRHVTTVPMSAVKSVKPSPNLSHRQLFQQEHALKMPRLFVVDDGDQKDKP